MEWFRVLGLFAMVLATAIIRTDRRNVRDLRRGKTIDTTRRLRRLRLSRLRGLGVVVSTPDGGLHVDEHGLKAWRIRRLRRMLVILGVVAALAIWSNR